MVIIQRNKPPLICPLEKSPIAVKDITYKTQEHCNQNYVDEIHSYGVSAKESDGTVPFSVKFWQ